MFKIIITHSSLKKGCFALLGLFVVLYGYHIARYYIVQPDCDYIVGTLNRTLEDALAYTTMVAMVLIVIQIISTSILKKGNWIIFNIVFLLVLGGLFYLFFLNTFLECLFHGVNLNLFHFN